MHKWDFIFLFQNDLRDDYNSRLKRIEELADIKDGESVQ